MINYNLMFNRHRNKFSKLFKLPNYYREKITLHKSVIIIKFHTFIRIN